MAASTASSNRKAYSVGLVLLFSVICIVVASKSSSPSSYSWKQEDDVSSAAPDAAAPMRTPRRFRSYHQQPLRFSASSETASPPPNAAAVHPESEDAAVNEEDPPENFFPRRVARQQQHVEAVNGSNASSSARLWDFELEDIRPDQVRRVRLNKPWRPRPLPSSGGAAATSVAASFTSRDVLASTFPMIQVEAIDTRTRLKLRGVRRCNKKLNLDEKAGCFLELNREYEAKLFREIVPGLKLLPNLVVLPPTPETQLALKKRAMREQLRDVKPSMREHVMARVLTAAPPAAAAAAASRRYYAGVAEAAADPKRAISFKSGFKSLVRGIERAKPGVHRRFFYDAGARSFESRSTSWFRDEYPESHEFHVASFDIDRSVVGSYPVEQLRAHFRSFELATPLAVWIHDKGVAFRRDDAGSKMARIVQSMEDGGDDTASMVSSAVFPGLGGGVTAAAAEPQPTFVHAAPRSVAAAAARLDASVVPSFDFAQLLIERHALPEEDLSRRQTASDGNASARRRLSSPDFVVVKMDVEGAEWKLLERLIETGAISLIDELFLEAHMPELGPRGHMHPHCVSLIATLRKMGVVAHRWV